MKNKVACRNDIKMMIKQIIREEMETLKREFEEIKRNIQERNTEMTENVQRSYSDAVRDNRKESILVVKSKVEQESEATKKLVKEKVDVKKLAVGIIKFRKGGKGSVILGCEERR